MPRDTGVFIADSADVEADAELATGVAVWQHSKIRRGARVGRGSKIGGAVYIGVGVQIGDNCKVENGAQLFEGTSIGDGVFIGPGALLLNDRYPRAVTPAGELKTEDDWVADGVVVDEGASVGGGAILLPGVHIGQWALVGAGSVVAGEVAAYSLVAGNPARRRGTVCWCGTPVEAPTTCARCGVRFAASESGYLAPVF